MKITNGAYPTIEEAAGRYLKAGAEKAQAGSISPEERSFAEILEEKSTEARTGRHLRFSKHASERLSDRRIELSEHQLDRLSEGVEAAGEKGIQDSLVMVDNLAFIVNTGSRTVVTAMDAYDASEKNVFSHIDGAVIA